MVVNTQITDAQLKILVASIYKCEPEDITFRVGTGPSAPEVDINATIKTDLDGAKRAAKILNAGKV